MAHLEAAYRATTSIMAPDLWGPWAAIATMMVGSPGAADRTKVVGDSHGPSDSSRRDWDNQRHGERGWYGDPEGHSEASRRRWEAREGGHSPRYEERSRRYDKTPSRSRSQYADDRDYRRNDDYERGAGGRGHGGWCGHPEGHSEASRRGWQNRR